MEHDPLPPAHSAPSSRRRRIPWRWIWPFALTVALGGFVGVGVAAAIHIPRVDSLASFTPSLVTQLYSTDGKIFATFASERRLMLKEAEIPPVLTHAVLASEDANFFRHGGIDALGIVRAAWADVRAGTWVEGASTISMQLARILFLTRERTWRRKIEEAFVAVELEKNYSKQQILTLYLNLVNLGHGNYGVESASRYYFGKPAAKLSLTEAATLVGILPAPSKYSPYRTPDVVLKQRNRVLRRMFEERYIRRDELEAALAQPLLVAVQQQAETFAPYFAEEVRKHLEATYGAATLNEGGLQVQTTLDPAIQLSAERAVRSGLLRLDHRRGWRGPVAKLETKGLSGQSLPTWGPGAPVPGRWYQGIVVAADRTSADVKIGKEIYTLGAKGIAWTGRREVTSVVRPGFVCWFRFEFPEAAAPILMLEQEPRLEGATVVLENATGAVRAMVGGWDFERNKFNRITQARRQLGSSFKPFVYGAALEQGWTPADTLLDAPTYFIGADGRMSYRPENYYKKHSGIVTLRRALEQSINVPAVKLLDLIGGNKVVDFAHRAGIKTQLPTWPSIALGSADLVPLQVAAAYSTFANQGAHVEPYFIERISSPDGQMVSQHFPATYTATSPAVAYVLTHLLEGVVDRGTAFEIHDLPLDVAGKTGTTDDFSDAWFVGYTPRYTILTWVGYDVKRSLGAGMSGAVAALPMWRTLVEDGLKSGWLQAGETFPVAPGVVFREVEYYTGLLPGAGSYRTVKEAFVAGTEPAREYNAQWSTITTLPWFQQKAFYIPKEGEKMPAKKAPEAGDAPGTEGVPPSSASPPPEGRRMRRPPPGRGMPRPYNLRGPGK